MLQKPCQTVNLLKTNNLTIFCFQKCVRNRTLNVRFRTFRHILLIFLSNENGENALKPLYFKMLITNRKFVPGMG
jgi:hypothetical protein